MVHKKNIDFEIILLLLREKRHLREISRVLEESHSTVLRKINFLIKEGVLDFSFEGRNKIFFIKNNLQSKNYIYNAERYKLIKLLNKYPKLKIILEEVINNSSCDLVILFGSYANFSSKESSDLDIYLMSNNKNLKKKIESINSKINIKLGEFDKSSLFIKEIIKNHIILKGVEKFYEKIEGVLE